MSTTFRPLAIRARLNEKGRPRPELKWATPLEFGTDGWRYQLRGTERTKLGEPLAEVLVSCAEHQVTYYTDQGEPVGEFGIEFIHASIVVAGIMPTYAYLKLLHYACFGDGYAYQAFVPVASHVNIHDSALHLWGRLDGLPMLPDFGKVMGSI